MFSPGIRNQYTGRNAVILFYSLILDRHTRLSNMSNCNSTALFIESVYPPPIQTSSKVVLHDNLSSLTYIVILLTTILLFYICPRSVTSKDGATIPKGPRGLPILGISSFEVFQSFQLTESKDPFHS